MRIKSFAVLATALVAGSLALPTPSDAADSTKPVREAYVAKLVPMNVSTTHHQTMGTARFEMRGDKLTITIAVKDAPPDTVHWQHFHGLTGEMAATCATSAADTNGDGIVDLIETEPASGTTMVPFDNTPSAMDVAHGVYPKASSKGTYTYRKTVSVKALAAAFAKAFDGQPLDLDKRVVIIHGVPSDTKLPASVQSLGPIPAQVTIPIACGKIEKVTHS